MEIEGLPDLKVEQAFELTDATAVRVASALAERSCAGSTIKLSAATVTEYIRSNVALLKNMVARGYTDARTMLRRVARMGKGAQVYLGSAELAAVCSLLGRIPTVPEYLELMSKKINPFAGDLYRYLNFDQISGFEDEGRTISVDDVRKLAEV